MLTAAAIKTRARAIGFDLCGIAPAAPVPEHENLRAWLDRGYAGTMAYLARTAKLRMDPRRVLPGARSVVVMGTAYNTDRPYGCGVGDPGRALISRYAWGRDYHDVIRTRLAALLAWMRAEGGRGVEARAFVDTGPVQEKLLAHHAGIGWLGRNGCVITAGLGSWVFLSVMLTTLDLAPDPPADDRCGTCTRCLNACPTGALVEPRVVDATRCISYLTVESKGAIPGALRSALRNRVFGCDVCQEVCPWNAGAPATAAPEWQPREGLDAPRLVDLWAHDDRELTVLVEGTPLARPGLAGLRRNLAVAIGNSGEPAGATWLEGGCAGPHPGRSPSCEDPGVQEHVDWARDMLRKRGIS